MENEKNKFKITKIEHYEELDEVNKYINLYLFLMGFAAIAVTCGITMLPTNSNDVFVLSLLFLNIRNLFVDAVYFVDAITRKKILKENNSELNNMIKTKDTKKLVLSKKWRK